MKLTIDAEERADSAEVLAALERVLSQPDFIASPRLSDFLRFVVTETLEGRGDRLKAFTIASMALGHDEKFNPTTNSIVRVQAGRLRRLIELYYRGPGRFDRCEIRLRRGSYVPEFVSRSEADLAASPPASPIDTAATPAESAGESIPRCSPSPKREASSAYGTEASSVRRLSWSSWLCSGSACRSGAPKCPLPSATKSPLPPVSSWAETSATIGVDRIEGPRNDPAMNAFAGDLETQLENALSRFDYPVVLHRSAGESSTPEPDYRLSGNLTPNGNGGISLAFRIWHPASGEIIWTRTFDDLHLEKTEADFEPTVTAVTAAVAQTYGAVFTDMRRRLSGRSDGFGCIILAYNYFKKPSLPAHEAARDCLEHAVTRTSRFCTRLRRARLSDGRYLPQRYRCTS